MVTCHGSKWQGDQMSMTDLSLKTIISLKGNCNIDKAAALPSKQE